MGEPCLIQRWDEVQRGLPMGPWHEEKGESTPFSSFLFEARKSPEGGSQKQRQTSQKGLQAVDTSCNLGLMSHLSSGSGRGRKEGS